jgi:GT2 family glycosyltransferase
MKKKVFISIIDYNGKKNTIQCLKSIDKITTGDYEVSVVVIDNASKDTLVENELKTESIPVKLITSKVNLGFSGGHNVGMQYAIDKGADYVLLLNNDTEVEKNFLIELLKVAESDAKIGAVGSKIYFFKGHEFHKDRYKEKDLGKIFWYAGGINDWNNVYGLHRGVDEVDNGQYDTVEETDFASGCSVLLNAKVLEEVGLFDDRYFLYYEDGDLQERIKRAGYKIYYAPKSVLWHINAASAGGSGSPLQDYYISRNRMLFGFLYAPQRTKFALLRESIKIMLTGREWQKKGVRDFYLKKFGKGSY